MKLHWLKVSAVSAAISFSCGIAHGHGKRIDLPAGNIDISLVPPAGLQPFPDQKMTLVREKGVAAKFIFSDRQSDVILAINTFGSNADEKGLSKVAEEIKAGAEKRSSDVKWLTNDLITMNGKKWLRLSFKDGPGGDELINEYFVTDWIGEYVLLNFTSTLAKYESFKSSFKRSAQSVQLGFIANSSELNKGVKRARKKH